MTPKYAASAKSPREICIQNLVPFRIRELQCCRSLRAPCTVDKNFDAAHLFAGRCKEIFDIRCIGHIARQSERTYSDIPNFTRDLLHQLRATPCCDYVRSRFRQPLRKRQPDSTGSANDNRGPILQIEKRVSHVNASPTCWLVSFIRAQD